MTHLDYNVLPWAQPDWLDDASAWIREQLGRHGWSETGPLEVVHQRPWSTLARVTTDHGMVYFKAPAPPFSRYEAALVQALERWRPDCSIPLIAVDLQQGWILSADAGATLRSTAQSVAQIPHWLHLLPLYAELQIEMIPRVPELLALGMFDRRLSKLPGLYAQLMESTENLRVGLEPGLTPDQHERLRALQPRIAGWCERLAEYHLPETLAHEELHDANVLVSGDRYIFTDWSDSSVAHPFFSTVVMLRAASDRMEVAEDGPEMKRLRDAYLEPWTRFEPSSRLVEAFVLAFPLGMINRALSWHLGSGSLSPKDKEAYVHAVPAWLQDFLEADKPS